jgi:hypothetical protein
MLNYCNNVATTTQTNLLQYFFPGGMGGVVVVNVFLLKRDTVENFVSTRAFLNMKTKMLYSSMYLI